MAAKKSEPKSYTHEPGSSPPSFVAEDGTRIELTADEFAEADEPDEINVTVSAGKSADEKEAPKETAKAK